MNAEIETNVLPETEAKVQRIVELFSDGEYQVNPIAVADAIIRRRRLVLACQAADRAPTPFRVRPRVRGIVLVGRLASGQSHY